jgi:hypothetical protein
VSCQIGYEVSATVGNVVKTKRSVVFTAKYAARKFQKAWPGAELRVVELCENGKIKRHGKQVFRGRRRKRR